MPETRYHPVRRYLPPLLLFLFYLSACIFIFILHEKRVVDERVILDLRGNVEQQCSHFRSVINSRFSTLDSLARFAAQQEALTSPDSLSMADAMVSTGAFSRVLIAAPSGMGQTSDGEVIDVGEQCGRRRGPRPRAHLQGALLPGRPRPLPRQAPGQGRLERLRRRPQRRLKGCRCPPGPGRSGRTAAFPFTLCAPLRAGWRWSAPGRC